MSSLSKSLQRRGPCQRFSSLFPPCLAPPLLFSPVFLFHLFLATATTLTTLTTTTTTPWSCSRCRLGARKIAGIWKRASATHNVAEKKKSGSGVFTFRCHSNSATSATCRASARLPPSHRAAAADWTEDRKHPHYRWRQRASSLPPPLVNVFTHLTAARCLWTHMPACESCANWQRCSARSNLAQDINTIFRCAAAVGALGVSSVVLWEWVTQLPMGHFYRLRAWRNRGGLSFKSLESPSHFYVDLHYSFHEMMILRALCLFWVHGNQSRFAEQAWRSIERISNVQNSVRGQKTMFLC